MYTKTKLREIQHSNQIQLLHVNAISLLWPLWPLFTQSMHHAVKFNLREVTKRVSLVWPLVWRVELIFPLFSHILYIGCFDIEKACDKVPRILLFMKLIKLGIGFAMLNALKAIYTVTSCILTLKGKSSAEFSTSCGIRQGASSLSHLFILFVNDLIDYIRTRCIS